jgi:hypothetical protein
MTTDITDAFVQQFESDVHLEYQRMGSLFRNTVRTKNGVTGDRTTFQVAGTGAAGSKSRHGNVPIMNASRAPVPCILQDRYAGEYIDKLDELKVNHDERMVAVQTIAGAFGRDTDDILSTVLDTTANANNNGTAATWSAAATPLSYIMAMGADDVPINGVDNFAVVCWEAWGDLLDIDEFSNQDYVPGDQLWFNGVMAKRWAGFNWFPHSGLPVDGSGDYKQFFYHRRAVGHAIQKDLGIDMWWDGTKQANLATGSMAHGGCMIDDTGVIEVVYDVTP